MMRFLRGDFFRIGGIAYQDLEDFDPGSIPGNNLAPGAVTTAGMILYHSAMFTRVYTPPQPRALFIKSDNFDRADVTPLAAPWNFPAHSPAPNRPNIVSHHVLQGAVSQDCIAFWDGDIPWEIDEFGDIIGQYSQIVLQDPLPTTATNYVGVVVRCDDVAGAAGKFYMAVVYRANDCRLFFWNGTSMVQLGLTNTIMTWAPGDTLRCEIVGRDNVSFITLFHNETIVIKKPALGANFKLGGGPGVAIQGTGSTVWLDRWQGGELNPEEHIFHRDNFNRADAGLGNPWMYPLPGHLRISSQKVVAGSAGVYCAAYWSNNDFISNHYSQVKMVTIPAAFPDTVGVICRAGFGIDAFYMGAVHGPNDYRIWLYWNDGTHPPGQGIFTQRAAGTTRTIAAGGVLRCECTGNTTPIFNMYYSGELILTYTFHFTTGTSAEVRIGGYPGMAINDAAGGTLMQLDDWEGGRM